MHRIILDSKHLAAAGVNSVPKSPLCVGLNLLFIAAGVLGALLIFAIAGMAVIFTVLSISAISTNGVMRGGGAYFMISRALGPEFGGAIGIVFFAANSVGITFYLVAFADELVSLVGGGPWMSKLYASAALLILLGISMVGASVFTKLNLFIFILLMASILIAGISFMSRSAAYPSAIDTGNSTSTVPHFVSGYTGFNGETLGNNLWVDFTTASNGKPLNMFTTLVIVFPALTGVMGEFLVVNLR